MKNIMLSLIALFFFTACNDKGHDAQEQAAHDAQVAQQARSELLAELEAQKAAEKALLEEKRKQSTLHQMGISKEGEVITIDINRTKGFFTDFAKQMESEMKKISDDLQNGVVSQEEAGINADHEKINIDLNKTKSLLETWREKIELFAKEFEQNNQSTEYNHTKGL